MINNCVKHVEAAAKIQKIEEDFFFTTGQKFGSNFKFLLIMCFLRPDMDFGMYLLHNQTLLSLISTIYPWRYLLKLLDDC